MKKIILTVSAFIAVSGVYDKKAVEGFDKNNNLIFF